MEFLIYRKYFVLSLLVLFATYGYGAIDNRGASHQSLCSLRPKSAHPKLEKWNLDPGATTVSGISNGGAFAVQISFIHSSMVHGAGIFAASPFLMVYLLSKWNPRVLWDVSEYYPIIDKLSEKQLIDSTDNLKGFKAYVYHGAKDVVVHPIIVKQVVDQYKHYGADVKGVLDKIPSGHCMPTNNGIHDSRVVRWQGVCTNATYEGVFDMFSHFYGPNFVQPQNSTVTPTGNLFKSDLAEFYPGCNPEVFGVSGTAWTYIPKQCKGNTQCKLHFAFHGYILPVRARVLANSRNAFVEYAGYLQAADANGVIIIFPEANWRGYDVMGYTGPETFIRRSGVQNMAIKKMIDRVIHGL